MDERFDIADLRRLELRERREGDVEGGVDKTAAEPRSWQWFQLPYSNDYPDVLRANKFVQLGDLRLLGNGAIVLGDTSFAHGKPINNVAFMGMSVSRQAGWGRFVHITTPVSLYRLVFVLDSWYQLVPSQRRLPRFVFSLWLGLRMTLGLVKWVCSSTVIGFIRIFELAFLALIIYLVVKTIGAIAKSGYTINL